MRSGGMRKTSRRPNSRGPWRGRAWRLCSSTGARGPRGFRGRSTWRGSGRWWRRSSIPVIGNGDVTTPEAARRMIDETGCAGVGIGRGAFYDPWIFRRTERYLRTGELEPEPDLAERLRVCGATSIGTANSTARSGAPGCSARWRRGTQADSGRRSRSGGGFPRSHRGRTSRRRWPNTSPGARNSATSAARSGTVSAGAAHPVIHAGKRLRGSRDPRAAGSRRTLVNLHFMSNTVHFLALILATVVALLPIINPLACAPGFSRSPRAIPRRAGSISCAGPAATWWSSWSASWSAALSS